MKKKMFLFSALVMLAFSAVNAQGGGGGMRMSVPDRVKMVMDKLADFKLDKVKSDSTSSALTAYYTSQQKMREEMMAGGGQPDRDAMREKMKKLSDERDDKLKKVFTDDQYKKWKDEIEPSLRPQRQGGGGGNN